MAAARRSDRHLVLATLFVDQIKPGLRLYLDGGVVLNKQQLMAVIERASPLFLMIHSLLVLFYSLNSFFLQDRTTERWERNPDRSELSYLSSRFLQTLVA